MNSSPWSSTWWRLDEQEPVDEQSLVEAGGGRRWMNSSPWRLEEVVGGDEQYPAVTPRTHPPVFFTPGGI